VVTNPDAAVFKNLFGNRAVLAGLLTRFIQGITGPITAILILHFFSPEVQGYYYTFGSLLALQIFVELGLSAIITTFAAHEWAALTIGSDGRITGDPPALARLAALAHLVLRWYLSAAAALLAILLAGGAWFFGVKTASNNVEWIAPWAVLCGFTALNFVMTPVWALLLGCGQIRQVNSYRLVESVLRSAVIWSSIALGAYLWSAALSSIAVVLAGTLFLTVRYRRFFASLIRAPAAQDWSWRKEIAPLQLRVGLSWLSGYFAFSMFTPVAFYFLGPSTAGQVGMTWAFVSGLSGLAATWIQVRSPEFGMLVAQRDFAGLDALARRTAWVGPLVCAGGGICGILALALLSGLRPDLAARFLPIGAVCLFVTAETFQQISMVQSTYLRAFKKEPFMWVSLGAGGIIGAGTLILTTLMGGYGSALSYLIGISVALLWGTIIFVRFRKEWTSSPALP
jgi:hypothetical protein